MNPQQILDNLNYPDWEDYVNACDVAKYFKEHGKKNPTGYVPKTKQVFREIVSFDYQEEIKKVFINGTKKSKNLNALIQDAQHKPKKKISAYMLGQ